MCLPTSDVDRFYRVWKPLLFYANKKYELIPAWKTANLDTQLRVEDVLQVRDRIWKEGALLDEFATQNAASLPDADIALVQSWKHRRMGEFILLKELKKHAIFLAQDPTGDVLAVKGLYSPFSDIFPYFPMMGKTVLLPYEGEIISDGLFQPYSVTFGGGMVREWNSVYVDAKERGEIITSLPKENKPISPQELKKRAEATNKKVLADFEKQLLRTGSSLKIIERDLAIVQQLTQAKLDNQAGPLSLRDLTEEDFSAFLNGLPAESLHNAKVGLKRFVQFMRDTGRLDWDEADEILMMVRR
jgi:hypothetical protein